MNMIWTISRYFMQRDLEMYDGAQDEPCRVRSMGLIDELGQVSHIFSDKTGTLTSNHMEFRRVVIDGMTYGVGDTAISRSVRENAGGGPVAPLALSTAKPPGGASRRPCFSKTRQSSWWWWW